MKVLVTLALMFPLMCHATVAPVTVHKPTGVYVCSKYTDNDVDTARDNEEAIITDNPSQDLEFKITKKKDGYTIKKNTVFPEGKVLTNPAMEYMPGFGGDDDTMLFEKEDLDGAKYFLVFITPFKMTGKEDKDNGIHRLLTVASCKAE